MPTSIRSRTGEFVQSNAYRLGIYLETDEGSVQGKRGDSGRGRSRERITYEVIRL